MVLYIFRAQQYFSIGLIYIYSYSLSSYTGCMFFLCHLQKSPEIYRCRENLVLYQFSKLAKKRANKKAGTKIEKESKLQKGSSWNLSERQKLKSNLKDTLYSFHLTPHLHLIINIIFHFLQYILILIK